MPRQFDSTASELEADILIVGGGLGGVAAAYAALRSGRRVILTEETDWLGGQLTTQGVPPDENPWIDRDGVGCTASYRKLRDGIRAYYRRNYPLLAEVAADPHFNPGMGNVSPLCHEPRVALAVINEMLAVYIANGSLHVLYNHVPVSAECIGDSVVAVTFSAEDRGDVVVHAPYIIDATELGDLLELAGIEHRVGAESQDETGELHALPGKANPSDQQAFSWCYIVDYAEGEDFTIERPSGYAFWRDYKPEFWAGNLLSWTTCDPETLLPTQRPLFSAPREARTGDDLWHYRRIAYTEYYPQGTYSSDLVVVNWPQIDCWLTPLVGISADERAQVLIEAQQLSLSMLYWMQTEAPRPEGGYGYPGLRLRGDLFGTQHGLAKSPYIRESRRIKAEFTVLEQHIGVQSRGDLQGAEHFSDSVGIGSYRIDLHPSTAGRNYVDVTNWPFQIPLGALIPERVENVLPGNKNIGVTHITNGCYRLHPVEWNIGEAAGALAAFCLDRRLTPRQVRNTPALLADFQDLITAGLGIETTWPNAIRLTPREKFDKLGI